MHKLPSIGLPLNTVVCHPGASTRIPHGRLADDALQLSFHCPHAVLPVLVPGERRQTTGLPTHFNWRKHTPATSSIQVAVADGQFDCHVAWPDARDPRPVIIVLQEIFGVNAGIRSITHAYAAKGYIAFAPDLFWRNAPGLSLSEDKEGDWERGLALYNAYDFASGIEDISAVAAAARSLVGASGKVGVTGYFLGGLLTYLSAERIDADAFVAYYGGGTDQYVNEADAIRSPLLYHLAGADAYIGPTAQDAIREALARRPGRDVHVYPGRDHAFARPDGHHYHAGDADLANARTPCSLEVAGPDGAPVVLAGVIADVYTKSGAEYLRLRDGPTVRLDDIRALDGQPFR